VAEAQPWRLLPRFNARAERAASEARIARILLETGAASGPPSTVAKATLAGDRRRLRGLPMVGAGPGAIAGSQPEAALLRVSAAEAASVADGLAARARR
jgi:hypothetical protein